MIESESNSVQLARIDERLESLTKEHGDFRRQIQHEMYQMRTQTHEWLEVMMSKLPTWAVVLGGTMASALGAMAVFILTHRWVQ